MHQKTKEKIEAFAKKAGFHKHATKEIWMENRIPNMKIIDLSTESPWIGIGASTAQRIEAEDSGIALIQDYKEEILQIYNSSEILQNEKPPEAGYHIPAPQQEQEVSEPPPISLVAPVSGGESHPFICSACKTGISTEQRATTVKAVGKAFCEACIHKTAEELAEKMKPKIEPKAPASIPEPEKETKKKPAGKKKEIPAPEPENDLAEPIARVMCQDCGFELSHIRALEYLICEDCSEKRKIAAEATVPLKSREALKEENIMSEKTPEAEVMPPAPKHKLCSVEEGESICSQCGKPYSEWVPDEKCSGITEVRKAPEPKPKEAEVMPPKAKPKTDKEISDAIEAAQAAKKPKNALVVGTCADLAKQYGIPTELANMYFMTLNDGLYIKNPGLLYLASKKGYGRIEVETTFDEEKQEYESTCKIYPKVTKEIMDGISHLAPEMQKIAWEYATAPTNGTGRASAKSVKMSTMHPFLKEMSQTRAQNRALRAYTGYGGTSLEDLPEAEVKYIEG